MSGSRTVRSAGLRRQTSEIRRQIGVAQLGIFVFYLTSESERSERSDVLKLMSPQETP